MTAAAQTGEAGPVANGDFESFSVPDEVREPLQDTPANECIGIGHQARWGSDTPLGALTGDDFNDMPENADPDPARLVSRYADADDPTGQAQADAEEQSGYGHCEFSDEKGKDAYWLNPAGAGGTTDKDAFRWSVATDAEAGFTADDDPFDKEIRIASNPSDKGQHNLYQNLFHPGHQPLFSANFDALEFDVEAGSIADDAYIQISLGAEPLNVQERYAAVYIDCRLNFNGPYLQDALPDGRVSASPVSDGVELVDWDDPDCPSEEDWETASEEERREILGRLSLVQLSFWNFNDGDDPIVVDNVALSGATTHAEEASDGNFRVCTDVAGPADSTTCEDDTVGKE